MWGVSLLEWVTGREGHRGFLKSRVTGQRKCESSNFVLLSFSKLFWLFGSSDGLFFFEITRDLSQQKSGYMGA